MSHRNPKVLGYWGPNSPRVVAADEYWKLPATLSREAYNSGTPRRMFCLSLGDFFEQFDGPVHNHLGEPLFIGPSGQFLTAAQAPVASVGFRPLTLDDLRERVLGQIAATPLVTWQVLTKRCRDIMPTLRRIAASPETHCEVGRTLARNWVEGDYPENVWVGGSVENQQRAWLQIEHLKEVPAACRFLSVEPMLDAVDLSPWLDHHVERNGGYGLYRHAEKCARFCEGFCNPDCGRPDPDAFHWVIIGGESGGIETARSCVLDDVRSLVEQLAFHQVPTWVKQLGTNPVASAKEDQIALIQMRHPKGEDMAEWPVDLQVQEFPSTEARRGQSRSV